MARVVYACKFEIDAQSAEQSAINSYQEWIQRHYKQRHGLENFSCDLSKNLATAVPNQHLLKSENYSTDKGHVTVIEWAYPAETDETLRWINEIRIGNFGDRCSVEHLIKIASIDYLISPAQFALGSPSVIRHLCSRRIAHVGDMQVQATAYALNNDGVSDFLTLLQSSLRRLPIIFLARFSDGSPNLIDAKSMSERLAGVAVVVAANSDATWDISDTLGRTLSCFDGGARVYWPAFSIDDDPRRHPLYLGAKIRSLGAKPIGRSIERSIFAVASFRFAADARITEVIRSAEQAQRAAQRATQMSATGSDWEKYALEIDSDLAALKDRFIELEAENENLRENQQLFFTAGPAGAADPDVAPEPITVPESPEVAVKLANEHENLIILDSAVSAAAASPFQRPAEIAEALQDLNEIAATWVRLKKERGSGGDLRQHLIDRGWGKRCSMHISDTTRKRYKHDYTFTYNTKQILFEPHITLGSGDPNSCASIHFMLDEVNGKIVVAHVGRHLPNTKT